MKKIAFFDTKPYDRTWFDALGQNYEITYFEEKLNHHTAKFTDGFDAVCAFVNDRINALAIERLHNNGVQLIAMRCAGYSNVDVQAAFEKLHIVRVPAYSPHAVAEHTMGLLLTLNRRLHKAYNRTREFNFSIVGLTGTDLYGKTVGVIGTGKIGRTFIEICRGFGMRVLAYDKFPAKDSDLDYVELDTLFPRERCDLAALPADARNAAHFESRRLFQDEKGCFHFEHLARRADRQRGFCSTRSTTARSAARGSTCTRRRRTSLRGPLRHDHPRRHARAARLAPKRDFDGASGVSD